MGVVGRFASTSIRSARDFEGWDDDPYTERDLVVTVGALRSQPRRRLGPGRNRFSREGMRNPNPDV